MILETSFKRAPLSKSTYIKGCQCQKALWLYKYKYMERCLSAATLANFDKGHNFGELAQHIFPQGVDASKMRVKGVEKSLVRSQAKWLERTQTLLSETVPAIFEAAFVYDGVFAAMDILVPAEDGQYVAYEVKCSPEVKDVFVNDCALQYYVLSRHIPIKDVIVVHLNEAYRQSLDIDVKDLTLDNCELEKLFLYESILERIQQQQTVIGEKIAELLAVIATEREPVMAMGEQCDHPYECDFKRYCERRGND